MGSTQPSGVLLIDKHAGVTSHDIVDEIRRMPLHGEEKVGHAGTLDPFATGLLIIVMGKATRYQNSLTDLPKTYELTAQFGARSDTGDTEGEIHTIDQTVDAADIESSIGDFLGNISQTVPMTSAVRVGGERLYKMAHRGERIDTPTRDVHIESIRLESFDQKSQVAKLHVKCGKGAYMRQLVEDLGSATGSAAYCNSLRRTSIGEFSIDDALSTEDLRNSGDLDSVDGWMPLEIFLGSVRIM